jgi:hypothetical protein
MRREIKGWINNKKEKILALHFFEFPYQSTFSKLAHSAGGFAKSYKPSYKPKIAKKLFFADKQLMGFFVKINWNNYDR